MGGGIMVPLHRASYIIIPEMNLRVASSDEHRRLINDPDISRAVVSFDWVTDCVEQDRLIGLEGYKLRSSPYSTYAGTVSSQADLTPDSPAASIKSNGTVIRAKSVVSPDASHNNTYVQDEPEEGTISSEIASSMLLLQQPTGQLTPPLSPNIVSVTASLKDMGWQTPEPEKTGPASEILEVPENLMDAFFWLEDKLRLWGRSDFGGSLVGFFTRVRMQVSLPGADLVDPNRIIPKLGTKCSINTNLYTSNQFPV
jgi:hypothetical protein